MKRRFPFYGWIGISLIAVFWWINWSFSGLRTHWAFFPLWLGLCLMLDAIVFYRSNTSLLNRSFKKYISLFLVSVPVWWLFEAFNLIGKNWFYLGREYFTDMEYFLLASLSFSVVIPVVFEAAELVSTFGRIKKIRKGAVIKPSPLLMNIFLITGVVLFSLEILFPQTFYFLTWFIVYFLIEPINVKMGYKNLLLFTQEGNWKPVVSLWCGCLLCAFFWEMWNYYSYPKWIYDLPHFNYLHVFEMPILGWIGYLPFALELFAIYNLFMGLFRAKDNYVVVDS